MISDYNKKLKPEFDPNDEDGESTDELYEFEEDVKGFIVHENEAEIQKFLSPIAKVFKQYSNLPERNKMIPFDYKVINALSTVFPVNQIAITPCPPEW